MSRVRTLGWWAGFFAASVLLIFTGTASAQNYKLIRRIPVGAEGGWDYIKVDADAQRLYVARGDHMMIVDEVSGKVLGDIPNTKGIHGTAIARYPGEGLHQQWPGEHGNCFRPEDAQADYRHQDHRGQSRLDYLRSSDQTGIHDERPGAITPPSSTRRRTKLLGTVDLGGKPEEPALDGRGNMFVNLDGQELDHGVRYEDSCGEGHLVAGAVRRAFRVSSGYQEPPPVCRLRQDDRRDSTRTRARWWRRQR